MGIKYDIWTSENYITSKDQNLSMVLGLLYLCLLNFYCNYETTKFQFRTFSKLYFKIKKNLIL